MISEETVKQLEAIEATLRDLSRRLAILEGDPQESESAEEQKARERAAYEERMKDIPRAFWREPQ